MGMSAGTSGGAQRNIKVTPIIDLLLVLLIIFMVITPLKPARFKTLVPEKSEELQQEAKQSPRTLTIAVDKDLSVTLTRGADQIVKASVNDLAPLSKTLSDEFERRRATNDWKAGFENRPELPADERIEKTVFVKAPQTFKYGEVVKVIDAAKGAGANPVGLQTELLEP